MKLQNKKLKRSLYRVSTAIGGTMLLISLILAFETWLGGEKTCHPTESWLLCQIRESTLLNVLEGFSILVALFLFILEAPERDKQAHYEAWKSDRCSSWSQNQLCSMSGFTRFK